MREIFIRKNVVNKVKWRFWIIVLSMGGMSALYEILEWFISVNTGERGAYFLGTQGYIWDTQSDILMAFIGAVLALIFCGKYQDKYIN
ncbi:DUF2238 domain-containing protein [Riemerella columbipharyngis]|uniref:Putative membrane protein n=1 Tax=Riemerella columbipharyngis TaxID=1071918 RepID=A0A1G7ER75_9FLAO|nr:DUF2238 domain-containing protein [Riemerella columbipharyngis]SDE66200.1 putative membrane protein [Riemerella columbipharyngis]